MGLGIVIKDSSGAIKVISAKSFHSGFDCPLAEALPIKEGLMLALSLEFRNIIVETDCLQVINLIRGLTQLDAEDSFNSCSFVCTPRSCNSLADAVARFARKEKDTVVWVNDFPFPFLQIAIKECNPSMPFEA